VLELITTWADNQVSAAFPNPSFEPIVYCFISADQLTQLAKDAHVITNLDELHKALGPWKFFQTHGAELLGNLRAAHYAAGEAITQASRKTSSQGGDIWVTVATPLSMSQLTPSQPVSSPSPPVLIIPPQAST